MMKLWNRFVHGFVVYSKRHVPLVCAMFARKMRSEINRKGLRQNFLLHLMNLWDNSLISSSWIEQCMRIVDTSPS